MSNLRNVPFVSNSVATTPAITFIPWVVSAVIPGNVRLVHCNTTAGYTVLVDGNATPIVLQLVAGQSYAIALRRVDSRTGGTLVVNDLILFN
jgi:hypothetical protein